MRATLRIAFFPVCLFMGLTTMCMALGAPQQRLAPFVYRFTIEEAPLPKEADLDSNKKRGKKPT